MAKAELNLDISENTVTLALRIVEAWLNYDREKRGVVIKKDSDDKYNIALWDDDAEIKAPDRPIAVARVACQHCGQEQYWQGYDKCIYCGEKLSI